MKLSNYELGHILWDPTWPLLAPWLGRFCCNDVTWKPSIGGSKIVGHIPFGPPFLQKQVAEPDRIIILFVCIIDDEYGLWPRKFWDHWVRELQSNESKFHCLNLIPNFHLQVFKYSWKLPFKCHNAPLCWNQYRYRILLTLIYPTPWISFLLKRWDTN